MTCILLGLLGLVVIAAVIVTAFIYIQGDCELHFNMQKRSKLKVVSRTEDRLDFEATLPIDNVGKEVGVILDSFMRIYLPQEQYEDVLIRGKVNRADCRRDDDYFEAYIIEGKESCKLVLRFEAYAKNGKTIEEVLGDVPDIDVAMYADGNGRGALFTVKEYFTINREELRALVK